MKSSFNYSCFSKKSEAKKGLFNIISGAIEVTTFFIQKTGSKKGSIEKRCNNKMYSHVHGQVGPTVLYKDR